MPRREDVEFLPPGIGERDTPPSTAAVSLALSIVLAFLIAVGWAYLGTLDVVAVARGRIVPQARVQVVQTAEPGIVRLIGARDGSMVRKGQILLELDPTVSDAHETRLTQELAEAKLHVARLEALIADAPRIAAPTAAGAEDVELQQRLLDDQRGGDSRWMESGSPDDSATIGGGRGDRDQRGAPRERRGDPDSARRRLSDAAGGPIHRDPAIPGSGGAPNRQGPGARHGASTTRTGGGGAGRGRGSL